MARIYLRLVLTGERSIDDVPVLWRETVEELLTSVE